MTSAVRSAVGTHFDRVDAAYLELAAPSLADALDGAVEQGARRIVIYPYFLNSGNHVEQDIPEIVERYRTLHPNCRFELMPHFGTSPEIEGMITEQILSRSCSDR